jgi:hypothetical protein
MMTSSGALMSVAVGVLATISTSRAALRDERNASGSAAVSKAASALLAEPAADVGAYCDPYGRNFDL